MQRKHSKCPLSCNENLLLLYFAFSDKNLTHFIFKGSPGCGKTTTILCLISQLLGDAAKNATLELNASDERGIDVIRERIKLFAQQQVTLPPGR